MRVIATTGVVLALALACTPAAGAGEKVIFSGTYDWSDGGSDELIAEFKAAGENEWKVSFRFLWNGDRRTWKGRASGSLEDGSTLEGTAGSGGRKWVFSGSVDDGVLTAEHTELQGETRRYSTGTFRLEREEKAD